MATGDTGVTCLLQAWGEGDEAALHRLTGLVLHELRAIARRYRRGQALTVGLETTALVNEVYIRLAELRHIEWERRGQFFGLVAQLMRRVLVDAARTRAALKRGGALTRVDVEKVALPAPEPDEQILRLEEALEAFARIAPRQAKVVELRYFGGLSEKETAEALETSERTVRRDWTFARAWLMRELTAQP